MSQALKIYSKGAPFYNVWRLVPRVARESRGLPHARGLTLPRDYLYIESRNGTSLGSNLSSNSNNSRRCRPAQKANASLSNLARPCGLHSFDFQRSGCCTVYPRCTSDCHLCRFYRISRNVESITYVSSIGGRNSIPTAPTIHLPDGWRLNKNTRGQKGAD